MPAALWSIIFEEGSDFDLEVTYQAADCTAKPITGYGASFQIRNNVDAVSSLVTASVANGRVAIAGASGIFSINIPAASIDNIRNVIEEDARYNFVIWPGASTPAVDPKRLLEGAVSYRKAYADTY